MKLIIDSVFFSFQSINGWKEIDVLKRINYRGKLAYSTLDIDYVFVDNLQVCLIDGFMVVAKYGIPVVILFFVITKRAKVNSNYKRRHKYSHFN